LAEDKRTVLSFPLLTDGNNGVYITGATTCLYTKNIWIGNVASKVDTTTYINGNIYINDTSESGKIHFPHPDNVLISGNKTLAAYIGDVASGKVSSVEIVAPTATFATSAGKLGPKGGAGLGEGSATQPVYFKDGIPVACTETFAT
jgi:hypothetical protein